MGQGDKSGVDESTWGKDTGATGGNERGGREDIKCDRNVRFDKQVQAALNLESGVCSQEGPGSSGQLSAATEEEPGRSSQEGWELGGVYAHR